MSLLSNTGLLASVKHEVHRKKQEERMDLVFDNISGPAPYVLRPFAGLYNPFPYGCSILCNHPADFEAKDVVRRAKETWATEGKPILLPEELNALRINALNKQQQDDGDEMVPEELFRRYTETDSRPITPAPTLASVMTHGSTVKGGRRCFTPDPVSSHNNQTSERPLLVLDLRRTQSQETLSWHGGPGGPVPTTVLLPPTRSPTPSSGTGGTSNKRSRKTIPMKKSPSDTKPEDHDNDSGNKLQQQVMKTLPAPLLSEGSAEKKEEEEIQRRRGRQRKKNKKHSRDLSSGLEKEFKGLPEPGETQVSAFGNESRIGSARPSLSVTGVNGGTLTPQSRGSLSARGGESNTQFGSSYLDAEVLKLLSRELDKEIIDNEFDLKRRIALEEAMRIFPPESRPAPSEEINKLKKELCLPPTNTELWLSLPRTFSRQSARFELPLDMDVFSTMTPLEYIKNHVDITSGRRMLYNLVFNRHKENLEEENVERTLPGEKIILVLGEMMGRPMTKEEGENFQNLVGWKNEDKMDFRTWCGLCALCERILGPEFCSQILSHEQDPCHEIEKADFDTLPRRLLNTNPDPRLVTILKSIRDT